MHSKLTLISALIIAPALLFLSIFTFQTFLNSPSPDATPISSPSIRDTEPNVFSPADYGPNCSIQNTCNNLVELDCQSAVDGPLYYIDIVENKVLQTCGGACMTDSDEPGICEECPPSAWQTCLNNKGN
ncbi:MAG: hypothetical protein KatS3mg087_0880 [Patescibacteria group bacterium]|nr:MAG: hypothetical protein KatS3mg087_0880 [Patescibacteria group bacterium]